MTYSSKDPDWSRTNVIRFAARCLTSRPQGQTERNGQESNLQTLRLLFSKELASPVAAVPNTPPGSRTPNLPVRSRVPCPFGQRRISGRVRSRTFRCYPAPGSNRIGDRSPQSSKQGMKESNFLLRFWRPLAHRGPFPRPPPWSFTPPMKLFGGGVQPAGIEPTFILGKNQVQNQFLLQLQAE